MRYHGVDHVVGQPEGHLLRPLKGLALKMVSRHQTVQDTKIMTIFSLFYKSVLELM